MPDAGEKVMVRSVAEAMAPDYAAKKRRILFTLLAYAGVFGAVTAALPGGNRTLDLIVSLPTLILAIAWCQFDANQHGNNIGKLMRFALVLAFVIAFPVYVFQTRGSRGFKTFALSVLFVAAMMVLALITGLITLYLKAVT